MRRCVLGLVLLAVVGCQGNEAQYDAAALRQARGVASTKIVWPGWGKPTSVGLPSERKLCEARTYHADPCVAVPTVHRIRKLAIHGEVFVWLERDGGRWRVVDSDYVTPDIEVTLSGGQPPPLLSP